MTEIPAQLQRASAALQRNDAGGCRALCNAVLAQRPDCWDAYHLRGLAAVQAGDADAAITDLTTAWRARPGNGHAAFWLGRLLRQAQRPAEALAPLEAASQHPTLAIDARYERARALTRLRRSAEAEKQYRHILERNPDHTDAAANLAFLLERRNRLAESARWVHRALERDPRNFIAALTQAVLQRREGDPEGARRRLEPLLARTHEPMNRSVVLNQLGQCLDRLGEWTTAFDRFRAANELLRQEHPDGRPVADGSYGLSTLRHLRNWLATHPPPGWTDNPHASAADPVFLVGFPRSGTTLLDQVLSTHSDIEVCEEFELFDPVRREWTEGDRLRRLPRMSPDELGEARKRYLDGLMGHRRTPERPVVVDKLPLNLAYLFLIHRLFPHSRVILALRDPRDACLSSFFQAFDLQGAMPYFLDLGDTARYYDAVMTLATETLAQVGNPVQSLRYEDLVGDFERQVRALIAFLGLEWRDEVLDYRRRARDRIIDTPSYQQVVKPLYTTSIGRWRHYRDAMEPVREILGPWVQRFGYAAREGSG